MCGVDTCPPDPCGPYGPGLDASAARPSSPNVSDSAASLGQNDSPGAERTVAGTATPSLPGEGEAIAVNCPHGHTTARQEACMLAMRRRRRRTQAGSCTQLSGSSRMSTVLVSM